MHLYPSIEHPLIVEYLLNLNKISQWTGLCAIVFLQIDLPWHLKHLASLLECKE